MTQQTASYTLAKTTTPTCPADIQRFLIEALQKRKASLIPFALNSPAVIEMIKHQKNPFSKSRATAYVYTWGVQNYCTWRSIDPDQLIAECTLADGLPNQKALQLEARNIDDYIGCLQDEKFSPGHITNCVKSIKCLFANNGLNLVLPYKMRRFVVTKDRAPTPEQLKHLVNIADIRGKVIVLFLALGGFRLGTLAKLTYRHVREDIENNRVPIHIHVEASITKGKYHDYDTFVGIEASEALKGYLLARKTGGLKIPPETLTDDSPLIRNEHAKTIEPITTGQLYNILHRLMAQAGFLGSKVGRRYTVRPHSIRKSFKTQLSALGMQPDYIEFMMGHTISTYHDIESRGIEFLRAEYAKANFTIEPQPVTNKMSIVYDLLKTLNLNPDQILSQQAQAMPHRTTIDYTKQKETSEQEQVNVMLKALVDKIKQDVVAETKKAV
jgi:hypothetical protein